MTRALRETGRRILFLSIGVVLCILSIACDLATSISGPTDADLGEVFDYTVTATDDSVGWGWFSPYNGTVCVDIQLPAHVSLQSVSSPIGSCSGTSPITCDLGVFQNNASGHSYPITVTVQATTLGQGTVTAYIRDCGSAEVPLSPFGDPDGSNNSSELTTTIHGCGDGVTDPGQDCDAGSENGAPGSCCSATCTFVAAGSACTTDDDSCTDDVCDGAGACSHPTSSAGTTCRAAVDGCDVAEVCDGLTPACPADVTLPDSDGDTLCDALDPCTNVGDGRDFVSKPKSILTLSKINTDVATGNDKVVLSATFALPAGATFGDLDPDTHGARVVVKTAQGADVLDASLPPGAYGGTGTRGWKTNPKGTSWQYLDKTAAPVAGIYNLKAVDRSKGAAGGQVRIVVNGKNATYPVAVGDEPLQAVVILGNQGDAADGLCGESAYQPVDCAFNKPQNSLKCRR